MAAKNSSASWAQRTRLRLFGGFTVRTEAVRLHLRVDAGARNAEPFGGRGGVAISAQRRGDRRSLDRAHRTFGHILEALAIAEAVEIDRLHLDAIDLLAGAPHATSIQSEHREVMRANHLAVAQDGGA